jgi:D-threo-aldose 1-dehydrogenase
MSLSFSLPRIGIGCAPLGSMERTFGFAVTEADAIATIQHAIEAGITLLDTAPWYGNGESELRVGKAIRGVPRGDILISSKVGWIPRQPGVVGDGERTYVRDGVRRSIEASLKRLGADYLDIAHIHDPESGDHRQHILEQGYPALLELKREGIIRAIGAGLNATDFLTDYVQHMPLDCAILAGRYTLLEQAPLHTAFPAAMSKGIGIIAAGIFNGGILATGAVPGVRYQYSIAPEPILRLARLIEAVCRKHGVSLRAAAMQFVAAHPAVQSLIIGMVRPSEVDENLTDLRTPIPAAFWAELKERGLIEAEAPTPIS